MFCYKCGYEINDEKETNFCPKCGTRVRYIDDAVNKTEIKKEHEEIDHKALEIYLKDLLGLEYIIRYLTKQKGNVKEYQNWYENIRNLYFKEYRILPEDDCFSNGKPHYLTFGYTDNSDKGESYWVLAQNYSVCLSNNILRENYDISNDYLKKEIRSIPIENGKNNPFYTIDYWKGRTLSATRRKKRYSVGICTVIVSDTKEEERECEQAISTFDKYYQQFRSDCKQGLANNRAFIKQYDDRYDGIKKELDEFESERDKAYSLNIIPKDFRDIYAVQYLTDFIETSRESLTTALLHYDLNLIKSKLDRIIDQQTDIIINQKIQEVQNEELLAQNKEYLEKLDKIASYTNRIAETSHNTSVYASIAATNAEVSALIGLANYLK